MQISLKSVYSFHQLGDRESQEDARFPDSDLPDVNSPCFVVCDGVGGNEAGEVASQVVCQIFSNAMTGFDRRCQTLTTDSFSQILDAAYDALDNLASKNSRLSQMGTTLTFLAFGVNGAFVAHIGDSRVYQIRPHAGILYRSSDHSLVNALVHAGDITPDEAINHPMTNYITRSMHPGHAQDDRSCATILQISDILPNDYFVLCTDGVIEMLNDEVLTNIIDSDETNEEKFKKIAAMSARSHDNNTLTLIQIGDVEDSAKEAWTQEDSSETIVITRRLKTKELHPIIEEVESIRTKSRSFLGRLWNHLFNKF